MLDLYLLFLFQVFSHDADSPVTKAEFKFPKSQCGYWDFPKDDDIKIISIKYVFYGPCLPAKTTKYGYQFDEDEAVIKYNKIKRKNK